MPVASNCEIGTVANCSKEVPQSPGHKSMVSLTVYVIAGSTKRVPLPSRGDFDGTLG